MLFRAGLDPRQKEFQRAVVKLQMALEAVCAEATRSGQVLICHRGTLDPLAYWLRNGWDEGEFFRLTGMSPEAHVGRYVGVLQLQTAAIGAALPPLARCSSPGDARAGGRDRSAVRPRLAAPPSLSSDREQRAGSGGKVAPGADLSN